MNQENVKRSFEEFIDKNYQMSKEILRQEIKAKVNDHLKDTLGLQNDPISLNNNEEDDE